MATEKQINANRLNGKKGGPKTPAGRAAVRNNALKHGLAAHHPVIPALEDNDDFNTCLNDLRQELNPVGLMEHMLVNQIADAYWRRQRIIVLEQGLFESVRCEVEPRMNQDYVDLTKAALLNGIAARDARGEDMLGRYYRYDVRFERSFFKALKELKILQAARQTDVQEEIAEQTQISPQTEEIPISEDQQASSNPPKFHPIQPRPADMVTELPDQPDDRPNS